MLSPKLSFCICFHFCLSFYLSQHLDVCQGVYLSYCQKLDENIKTNVLCINLSTSWGGLNKYENYLARAICLFIANKNSFKIYLSQVWPRRDPPVTNDPRNLFEWPTPNHFKHSYVWSSE